jgi:hypothetical protein
MASKKEKKKKTETKIVVEKLAAAPERNVYYVDVTNLSEDKAKEFWDKTIDQIKREPGETTRDWERRVQLGIVNKGE